MLCRHMQFSTKDFPRFQVQKVRTHEAKATPVSSGASLLSEVWPGTKLVVIPLVHFPHLALQMDKQAAAQETLKNTVTLRECTLAP